MIENPVEMKNLLLERFNTGKINMEELDRECAYWFVETLETISRKPDPTKPHRLAEYEEMDYSDKKEVPLAFWHIFEIKDFMEKREMVRNENKANIYWCEYWTTKLPEEDFVNRQKLKDKANELRDFS